MSKPQKPARQENHEPEDDAPAFELPFPVPQDPAELAAFVRRYMRAQVGATALTDGSDGPLAYLVHSFFEGRFVSRGDGTFTDTDKEKVERPPADCTVWANRGGGKTFLGAVATALDLLFKPGIEVRILGGSAEQSRRMHEHLRRIFEREELEPLLSGRATESKVRLRNRSRVEVLSHSERSVRGVRVQKLRCDEVDVFDKALWEAAQLVTRSEAPIKGPWGDTVRGVVEVLSTMHVPMGLMWEVVDQSARSPEWAAGAAGPKRRVLFKWGVVDALEVCGHKEECAKCVLHEECAGRAKVRPLGGHMSIRDARVMKMRVSAAAWASEMLCKEPSRSGCVYPEFSIAHHVVDRGDEQSGDLLAGMDFGVRCPTVVLWARLNKEGLLSVIDEYHRTDGTLAEHVSVIKARQWGEPLWIGIDPAGAARNEQTGVSNQRAMRNMGLSTRAKRFPVGRGIELVRRRLSPASGPPRLRVSPRCTGLIEAMARYRYDENRPRDQSPVKDGHDHWCDALRYLVVSLEATELGQGLS